MFAALSPGASAEHTDYNSTGCHIFDYLETCRRLELVLGIVGCGESFADTMAALSQPDRLQTGLTSDRQAAQARVTTRGISSPSFGFMNR